MRKKSCTYLFMLAGVFITIGLMAGCKPNEEEIYLDKMADWIRIHEDYLDFRQGMNRRPVYLQSKEAEVKYIEGLEEIEPPREYWPQHQSLIRALKMKRVADEAISRWDEGISMEHVDTWAEFVDFTDTITKPRNVECYDKTIPTQEFHDACALREIIGENLMKNLAYWEVGELLRKFK